jgi:hypothetical protein
VAKVALSLRVNWARFNEILVEEHASEAKEPIDARPPDRVPLPPLISLMDLSPGTPDPRKTVLGERFLCIGGAMLFVGPSGIGKSSASVQQDLLWGLGREAFGIRPARPLRILTIQAENDAEDLAEMREGVCNGLGLAMMDRFELSYGVFYETINNLMGPNFLAYLNQRLDEEALRGQGFDLLRIDPMLGYLGADPSDIAAVSSFLRNGLNPILSRYQVAAIVNHHTGKTTGKDTSGYRHADWQYAGMGSSDATNWARAILVIDPTHDPKTFKFIAAKRGGRIGWRNATGEKEFQRLYCHASDGLSWRDATDADRQAVADAAPSKGSKSKDKTPEDLIALVPLTGSIPKNELLEMAHKAGFAKNPVRDTLNALIGAGKLHVISKRRSGTGPEKLISRNLKCLLDDFRNETHTGTVEVV